MLTLEQQIYPVWDTDVMWEESVTFVMDRDGTAKAPLLFPPKKILRVTDARGQKEYFENTDWVVADDMIIRTSDSSMFVFSESVLYPYEAGNETFKIPNGNLKEGKGSFFHDRQIVVSYTCEKGKWTGIKPEYQSSRLPKVTEKIKNGETLKFLVYGDSISVGAQSSGILNVPPYQKNYFNLLCDALENKTGCTILRENPSVGGKDITWAAENAEELVGSKTFDLLILGFGMNDGWKTPEQFEEGVKKVIVCAKKTNPDAEALLIATSTPNPIMTHEEARFWGNQYRFKESLEKLVEELAPDSGMAVADITSMQKYLHGRKRFIDTTANNVNHPNDFFYRLYAQFLMGMLAEG